MIDALIILSVVGLPAFGFYVGWNLGYAKAGEDILKYNERMREGDDE